MTMSHRRIFKGNDSVWVWGTGSFGRSVAAACHAQGVEVYGVVQSTTTSADCDGLPVYPLTATHIERGKSALFVGIFNRDVSLKIDFIKLDIEGAELQALQGAANTIMRDQPVLAISAYHRPQDLWMLPKYIRKLCPEYRIFFRQHHLNSFELVLYAISETIRGRRT